MSDTIQVRRHMHHTNSQAHTATLDGDMGALFRLINAKDAMIVANASQSLIKTCKAITADLFFITQLNTIESNACDAPHVSPADKQQDGLAHIMCDGVDHKTMIANCEAIIQTEFLINQYAPQMRILTV